MTRSTTPGSRPRVSGPSAQHTASHALSEPALREGVPEHVHGGDQHHSRRGEAVEPLFNVEDAGQHEGHDDREGRDLEPDGVRDEEDQTPRQDREDDGLVVEIGHDVTTEAPAFLQVLWVEMTPPTPSGGMPGQVSGRAPCLRVHL